MKCIPDSAIDLGSAEKKKNVITTMEKITAQVLQMSIVWNKYMTFPYQINKLVINN